MQMHSCLQHAAPPWVPSITHAPVCARALGYKHAPTTMQAPLQSAAAGRHPQPPLQAPAAAHPSPPLPSPPPSMCRTRASARTLQHVRRRALPLLPWRAAEKRMRSMLRRRIAQACHPSAQLPAPAGRAWRGLRARAHAMLPGCGAALPSTSDEPRAVRAAASQSWRQRGCARRAGPAHERAGCTAGQLGASGPQAWEAREEPRMRAGCGSPMCS
jgi:hypothetical protein